MKPTTYPTHYSLTAALRRRGYVADMFDHNRFNHINGSSVRAILDGSWKVVAA